MNLALIAMFLILGVVAGGEIVMLQRFAAQPAEWLLPLTIHLAISGLLAALAAVKPFREDRMWPLLGGITVAVAGPIGAVGTMISIILTVFHRRKEGSFEEWYEALFPESIADFQGELMARIRANDRGEGQGISAFSDILAFGTVAQKRELITLITKHFEPRFAAVLKIALDDANNATRVQAASAVAKIQDDFSTRSQALKQSATSSDPDKILELARHFDEHARTGLLDPDGSEASRKSALQAYRRYLELTPKDANARAAVGRLLLQSGEFEEVCIWLKESVERNLAPPEGVTAYTEALFRLRRYADVRAIARKYAAKAESWNMQDESVEALKLWAKGYETL